MFVDNTLAPQVYLDALLFDVSLASASNVFTDSLRGCQTPFVRRDLCFRVNAESIAVHVR